MVLHDTKDLFHRKADEASRPKSEKFLKYLAEKKASKYCHPHSDASTAVKSRRPHSISETASSFPSASGAGSSIITPQNSLATPLVTRPASSSLRHVSSSSPSPRRPTTAASGVTSSALDHHRRILVPDKKQQQQQDHNAYSMSSTSSTTVTTTPAAPVVVSISHQDRAAFLSKLAAATAASTNKENSKYKKNESTTSFSSSSRLNFSRPATRREVREHQESDISYDESRNPSDECIDDNAEVDYISDGYDERNPSDRHGNTTTLAPSDVVSSADTTTYDVSSSDRMRRMSSSKQHHLLEQERTKTSSSSSRKGAAVTQHQARPLSISQRVAKASRYSAIKEARIQEQEQHQQRQQQQQESIKKNFFLVLEEKNKKMNHPRISRPRSPSPPSRPTRDMNQYDRNDIEQEHMFLERYPSERVVAVDRYPSEHQEIVLVDQYPSERAIIADRYPSQRGQGLDPYPSDRAIVADRYPSPQRQGLDPFHASERAVVVTSLRSQTPSSRNSGGWKTVPPFVKKISDIFMGNDIPSSHKGNDIPPISSIEIGPAPTENSFETNL